jgi:tRNA A-37 threonylcarbamoyl transferase component Bud32
MDEAALKLRIAELTGRSAPSRLEILTDTSEFMNIFRGHVLRLDGRSFHIEGDMREGRFGVDDQPKFWVKKAIDLDSGEKKILKLVFHEEFRIRIGLLRIRCYRDPAKEARILDLVRGDSRFMQGETLTDDHGKPVRVADFIRGENLYEYLTRLTLPHETYFRTILPGVLHRIARAFEAVAFLHQNGQHHGDIRNDHLIIESATGRFRWIDFDLCQDVSDFDVWSLGNVLLYAVGMGEHTFHDQARGRLKLPAGVPPLTEHDASAFFVHRIINLRKLFPWIPVELNDILMHFSFGTTDFYETVEEILADLRPVVLGLDRTGGRSGTGVSA